MENILSPITKSTKVNKIRTIDVNWIINQWKKNYSYDVTYLFKGINQLNIYECQETGYKYFYPTVMGDSRFYDNLSKFDWYYMPWKWEHEQVSMYIKNKMNLLEVGCGSGDYLNKINSLYEINTLGIEMNKSAISKARSRGINIEEDSLEVHSLKHKEYYDIVCSFQVLEHIADVASFIESSIYCLKTGGKLIVSVPNNGSFISETDQFLNMPPHHVGLWDERSLRSLVDYNPIKLENLLFEPIQKYHLHFFKQTVYRKVFSKLNDNKYLRKAYSLLIGNIFVSKHLDYVSKWIPGHTILAIYTKQ